MRAPKWRLARFTRIALLAVLVLPLRSIAADETPIAAEKTPSAAIDLDALRKDREQKAGRHPVAKRISRYLAAAAEAVDAGNPEQATELLKKLYMNRLNPYDPFPDSESYSPDG